MDSNSAGLARLRTCPTNVRDEIPVRTRDAPRRRQDGPGSSWNVCIPGGALDARTTHRKPNGDPITGREQRMLLILENYCRTRCYCWPSNASLAAAAGCKERNLLILLKEMEDDGLIQRKWTGMKRAGKRTGIFLLKRLNPDLGVAEPAEVDDFAGRLEGEKASLRGQRSAPSAERADAHFCAPATRTFVRPADAHFCAPGIRTNWGKKDEEKSSSSVSLAPARAPACEAPATGADDDDSSSTPGGGDRENPPEPATPDEPVRATDDPELVQALTIAARVLGPDQAETIRAEAPRIVAKIRAEAPRIEMAIPGACVVFAIYRTLAKTKAKEHGIRSSLTGYFWACAVGFAKDGISAEAKAAAKRFQGEAADRAARSARAAAAAAVPVAPEPDPPPTAEEIAKARRQARGEEGKQMRNYGRVLLGMWGIALETPAEAPGSDLTPGRPDDA